MSLWGVIGQGLSQKLFLRLVPEADASPSSTTCRFPLRLLGLTADLLYGFLIYWLEHVIEITVMVRVTS